MFDLVVTALSFAKDFFGDDDKKMLDPKYSDFAKPSKGSSFLDFDFIKKGAKKVDSVFHGIIQVFL